jgi:hypothetical protein
MNRYQVMPDLTPDQRARLKEAIRQANGIQVPVEEDEHGNILDGRYRVELWHELRAEGVRLPDYPRFIRPGLTDAEKRAHARALNLARRQLTREQQWQLIEDQLRETPEQSDNQIAGRLGVDNHTVARRRRHLEATGEIPKLEKTVGRDGKSRPARRPAIIAKDGKEAQRASQALGKMPAEALPAKLLDVKRAEKIARRHRLRSRASHPPSILPDGSDLRVGDFEQALADVPDGSVHLILTDPPYLVETMPLWPRLSRLADRVLREDGLLLAYTGQYFIPTVLQALLEHLDYHWILAAVHAGRKAYFMSRYFHQAWKPILVFTRRGCNRRKRWTCDVLQGDGAEKDLHEWQQGEGEAAWLIEKFSEQGDLVLDPFLGSGTTAAAAVKLGRRFIGCDINPGTVAIAQERLAALVPTVAA